MPEGNKSVVMNASTDLMAGEELDAQVQITITPDGTAFLTTYGTKHGLGLYLRINADEWTRMERLRDA